MIGMNARTGLAITDEIDHIQQSIADILMTPIGSRLMRRDYGSYVPRLIDQPLTGATILMLYSAATISIMRWEPRITISRIQHEINTVGGAELSIEGSRSGSGSIINMMIPMVGGA